MRAAVRWSHLLARPLATDEHQASFWVRYLRIGVVLTLVTAAVVSTYALVHERPRAGAVVACAALVAALVPALLALPMGRWCQDRRGALLLYAWSGGTATAIGVTTLVDGGATSPLMWLFVLPLTFAGPTYPPAGVVLVGAMVVAASTGAALLGGDDAGGAGGRLGVPVAVLVIFTVMTAWASRNHWQTVQRQQLLTRRMRELADTDALTGCANRRAFTAALREAVAGASTDRPVSVCLLDLDDFKRVNDTHGHAAGDAVLLGAVAALRGGVRAGDALARLGGDEFAVLMPGTGTAEAGAVARRAVAQLVAALDEHGVGASAGVATTTRPTDLDALLAEADRRMYLDKRSAGARALERRAAPTA